MEEIIGYTEDWNGRIETEGTVVAFRWNDGSLEFCRTIYVWQDGESTLEYRWSAIPQKGDESLSGFE